MGESFNCDRKGDIMNRRRFVRLAIVGLTAAIPVAAALALVVVTRSGRSGERVPRALPFKKGDSDEIAKRKNVMAAINEARDEAFTPAVEAYLLRAYPADDVPAEASIAAQGGWRTLNAGPHSPGSWQLIGPSQALTPSVLNVFLYDGAPALTSGRVTALANGPKCSRGDCPIYLAAAGGGIWRAKDGLAKSPKWEFVSGSFGTNAIGSLILDPNDASGRTLYAGTGEPNASADSEAGVGIYKSTDAGQTWSLVPGSDIFFQRSIGHLALDNAGKLLVPIASGVRGISSVLSGGASSSGNAAHPLVTRGLWRQTGATFTLIWPSPPPVRGSTMVKVDPTHAGVIYVNAFQQGIWRSKDNGVTFVQIFAPQDATVVLSAIDRSEFDVTTLSGGATRMYVGEGQGGGAGHHSNFWRSDNADTGATFTQMGGAQVDNYCTGQCWYDNVVYTPKGYPDVVYLMGSFDYNTVNGPTNGRAVLLSTDGGATWSDMSQDGDRRHAGATHPDQHAMVTNPNNPFQYWEGSDGGLVRSDGKFADVSYKCDQRGLDPASTAFCKSLLWRVPNELAILNDGLSTLQFQSLSVSPKRPRNNIQGGTQDNGTWQYTGSSVLWVQEIYGDGGQSGFSSADDRLRFNTFFGQASDVNFRNGDPTKWVIATGPIVSSPEGSFFYPPVTGDPHPANWGTIFQGSLSVWRTQDWGGNREFLEANCPEFTTSAAEPTCGDFVRIGTPAPSTQLTSAAWGTRAGSAVAAIERTPTDTSTLWAATGTGRVFISDNSDAISASAVIWQRIDNTAANSPGRFISSIYPDPQSPHHAWISYSGYSINTPATPGHVFEVTWNGAIATWVDKSYDLPDFPITDLVRDDLTGDLYAASDFGVMRLASGSTTWTAAGTGLPMVEVAGLTIVPSARILYAATHGRSAWKLRLPGAGDENEDQGD